MQCSRCGATISSDDERCARCGALAAVLVSAPPLLPDAQGIPVARFSPTPAGAPAAPEPYLSAETGLPLPLGRGTAGLRLLLPLPTKRRAGPSLWTSMIFTLFVAGGLATGVLALTGVLSLPLLPGAKGTSSQIPVPPSATATPACLISSVVSTASAALSSAQLASGVRDEAAQDFRPVDNVSTFHAGTRAYLTFEIVTPATGTAEVTFCTPDGSIPGTLEIPAKSGGRYAQFSLLLPQRPLGDCVATLKWNGAVAASLPFTVEP